MLKKFMTYFQLDDFYLSIVIDAKQENVFMLRTDRSYNKSDEADMRQLDMFQMQFQKFVFF